MNVVIEDDSKKQKRLKIFYISIIVICIIAIIAALVIQIAQEKEPYETGNNTNTELPELTDDKISAYKEQFNNIFGNKVNYLENNAYKINKINEDEEIVYLGYKNNEIKANDYELKVNIPYINIKDEVVDEFNKQIKEIF